MEQYLSNMLERTNNVISNVMNKVFRMRPNLLNQMHLMHESIEKQLKSECDRELELILEMEESFVYADNPLYKETLRRTKRIHRQISHHTLPPTTTIKSLKRNRDAISEDNDDDDDLNEEFNPPVKISRPNGSSTNRFSSCKYVRLLSIYI